MGLVRALWSILIVLGSKYRRRGLGFNHIEKASIMSQITALLYFLPLFLGVIADRIGYKLSLIIAYVIMIIGYYFLGHASTYWSVYFLFLLVALGAAMFKPVASGIVSKSTNKDNGTIGFGIFYMMVNIGGFVGPASSSYLRTTLVEVDFRSSCSGNCHQPVLGCFLL